MTFDRDFSLMSSVSLLSSEHLFLYGKQGGHNPIQSENTSFKKPTHPQREITPFFYWYHYNGRKEEQQVKKSLGPMDSQPHLPSKMGNIHSP